MKEEKDKELNLIPKAAVVLNDLHSDGDVEKALQKAERFQRAFSTIIKRAYNLTNVNDWIDQNGTPYLQFSGSTKIATQLGINIVRCECAKEVLTDDDGKQYIEYTYEAIGVFLGRETHEVGVANSKDDFFAKRKKNGKTYLLPLSEINLPNVKKKAHTNLLNRLIKNLVGLSHTWEEISEITDGKITREKCSKVSYKSQKKELPNDIIKKRAEIRTMIIEMHAGNAKQSREYLKSKTAWVNKQGKKIEGIELTDKLTENQINFLYPKIKQEHTDFLTERGIR